MYHMTYVSKIAYIKCLHVSQMCSPLGKISVHNPGCYLSLSLILRVYDSYIKSPHCDKSRANYEIDKVMVRYINESNIKCQPSAPYANRTIVIAKLSNS